MSRKCSAGQKWDKLLVLCMPVNPPPTPPRPTVTPRMMPGPWRTPVPNAWADPPAGPFLWAAVAVVATGSVLALVLWTLIYRRHRHHCNRLPPPALEPTDKADPLAGGFHVPPVPGFQLAEPIQKDPEPPCPDLNVGSHSTGSRLLNDIALCMGGLKPGGTRVGEARATTRKHRIPLPATELGDTTLVTAKTCRDH